MLHKTRGIVLHHIRYSESSLIVRILTEAFGLQSYLVKGARSKRSVMRSSLFQPLTLLDMVVYHRERKELQHIREAEVAEAFHSFSDDVRKSTIAMFVAELLLRSVKEAEAHKDMFAFLASSLHHFDLQDDGVENFHLYLLVKLCRYLGFSPQGSPAEGMVHFDLREGKFTPLKPLHPDYLNEGNSRNLYRLLRAEAGNSSDIRLNSTERESLLTGILTYYQIHQPGMGRIRSLEVLKEVFR